MPRPSIWRLGASPLLGELGPEQLPEQLTAGKTALVAFFRRIHPRRPCSATSRVPFHRGVCRRPALCCLRRPTETSRSGGDTNGSPMTGRWWLFAPPPPLANSFTSHGGVRYSAAAWLSNEHGCRATAPNRLRWQAGPLPDGASRQAPVFFVVVDRWALRRYHCWQFLLWQCV